MLVSLANNFLIRLSGVGIGYLALLLNGRFIENTLLGEILLGITFVNMLNLFSSMGYSNLIIKNIHSEYSIRKNSLFRNILIAQWFVVAIFYTFLCIFYNLKIFTYSYLFLM